MTTEERQLTLNEFVEFVHRAENQDQNFELIHGEIVEVSHSQSNYSGVSTLIAIIAGGYCRENNLPGNFTCGDGTYGVLDHVIAPDVAFKRTPLLDVYPDPVPPEWAVEVISPHDKPADVAHKRQIYIDAGILCWEVYLKDQRVDVYAPGKPRQAFGIEDTLECGDMLPGFLLPVKDIFPPQINTPS